MTQPAYLIVHKLALYNDVWYDDWTLNAGAANPTAILTDSAAAEALARQLTRDTMRGALWSQLQTGEHAEKVASGLRTAPIPLPAHLTQMMQSVYFDGLDIPATLTDAELDAIIDAFHIHIYYVLQTEATIDDIEQAQSILTATPERPRVYVYRDLEYDPESDGKEMITVENIAPSSDPAAERLNRVTALFGRKYAFEPNTR